MLSAEPFRGSPVADASDAGDVRVGVRARSLVDGAIRP